MHLAAEARQAHDQPIRANSEERVRYKLGAAVCGMSRHDCMSIICLYSQLRMQTSPIPLRRHIAAAVYLYRRRRAGAEFRMTWCEQIAADQRELELSAEPIGDAHIRRQVLRRADSGTLADVAQIHVQVDGARRVPSESQHRHVLRAAVLKIVFTDRVRTARRGLGRDID